MLFRRDGAKKSRLPLLFIVAAFPLVAIFLQAQEGGPPASPNLFVAVDIPGWQDPFDSTGPAALRSRPVWVSVDLLNALDPEAMDPDQTHLIQFNLFDDVSVAVLFDQAEPRWPSDFIEVPLQPIGYAWHGLIVGDDHGHVVVITELPGICIAGIDVAAVGSFEVRPAADGLHVVRELDRSAPWVCGMDADGGTPIQGSAGQAQGGGGEAGGSGCDDGDTLDVIVLYTPAAKDAAALAGQNIELEIDLAIRNANGIIYPTSGISTELRLLYKAEIAYVESGFGIVDLSRLRNPWDGELDEINPLRDTLRADLFCLIFFREVGGGSAAYIMREDSPIYERSALSVVDWTQGGQPLRILLTHELAHNMGCGHDRPLAGCVGCVGPQCDDCPPACTHGAFPYSFAYNFELPGGAPYRTIMADGPGTLLAQFSNPHVLYCDGFLNCAPTGVDINPNNCDWAHNALSINMARGTVAKFRTSASQADTTAIASFDFFAGQAQGGNSTTPSVSHDGQIVAFASNATNFAESDFNGTSDIFFYNRESGLIDLVSGSVPVAGRLTLTGDGPSFTPAVSGNGRFIAFATDATDLVLGDGNGLTDVYAFNRATNFHAITAEPMPDMKRISVDWNGSDADGPSFAPSISRDGRFVAFASDATDLLSPGMDNNGLTDVFLRDRDDVLTTRVSVGPGSAEADGPSFAPSISADGQYVAFESDATNLLGPGNDTNGVTDIFVYDRVTGQTVRVSVSYQGTEANKPSHAPSISADGRFVAFHSNATNIAFALLYAGQGGLSDTDVFVHDRDADENDIFDEPGGIGTKWISHALGFEANGDSFFPSISANGRFVAFQSEASNLVGGDGNSATDVFVHDLETDEIIRASINSLGEEGNGASISAAISDDGRFIAFASNATLVPNDLGAFTDVFFRDRGPMRLGDLNGDGIVDVTDEDILKQNWGDCPCCAADLDGDGTVGDLDLLILLANWG